jgi:tRNA A58 N-methylase Trm61
MNYTEPYVPMPEDIIPIVLQLASLKRDETVFDLGSGDGRVLIVAARDFHAVSIGVEIRKRLIKNCLAKLKELGLSDRVKISCRNFKEVGLRRADVLALYLSGYTLSLLVPKFTKELKPGTRIVNFDFPILGWTPECVLEVVPKGWRKAHPIYLYEV